MKKLLSPLLCGLVALGTPVLSAHAQSELDKPVITKQSPAQQERVKKATRQGPKNTLWYHLVVRPLFPIIKIGMNIIIIMYMLSQVVIHGCRVIGYYVTLILCL